MTAQARYNPVTDEIVARLEAIVGERFVIHGDPDKLEPYSHDEVPDPRYAHMPEAVVRPQSAQQIAEIMKLANRELIPVTPRGAGSGLSGGAVPVHGGIVLLVDRMNRILDIDLENMMVVVEPGVVTNEINQALASTGLFYAGYPMSLETSFIGGNVAENAGGGKAVKYGVTGRYVTALEMVSPTGEIVSFGGKLVKDVTGYNLVSLMVGSEGTLGIFTKITLKLLARPGASVDLLALFETTEGALAAVPPIMTAGGLVPTAIDFMDRTSVQTTCQWLNETLPYERAGAMLLITVDGPEAGQVERDYEAVGEQLLEAGAIEVYVADNSTNSERIWRVRRSIAEAFNAYTGDQSNEDIVVPMAGVGRLVAGVERLSKKHGAIMPAFGHAGDGNLHIRVIKPPKLSPERWELLMPKIVGELYDLTVELGGKISGEHGIGHKRKKFMPIFVPEPALEMMRAIKRALDPNNVLNPGKIFDL